MDYKTKKEEMKKKYEDAVNAISVANGVDVGVAFEMLRADIINGGKYPFVNEEEFKKDYEELLSYCG